MARQRLAIHQVDSHLAESKCQGLISAGYVNTKQFRDTLAVPPWSGPFCFLEDHVLKDKMKTRHGRFASRSPPAMSSGEQRVEALQEFSRVLGRLLGRRWLRQQVESVDAQELPAAIRRRPTK